MYTVGRLAKRHGLTRSTLLYYDRIGLLRPTSHVKGEYRQYSAEDDARLGRICAYRKAGIGLKTIGHMLDDPVGTSVATALEERLAELNGELAAVKEQQALVARLLDRRDLLGSYAVAGKAQWESLLSAAGFNADDVRRWHGQFERSAPARHEAFLRRLEIPPDEISAIRAMAGAPHRILNLNKESGRFMEMFFKLYEGLEREGPGSLAMTRRAYTLCQGLPDQPLVLELGCGSGGATLDLAAISGGTITATDVYQPYLDRLLEKAQQRGVAECVSAVKQDMADLDFPPASFDLIWCEGAAYIMGVDRALEYWKQFLKPGGCLVFSDAVWLSAEVRAGAPEVVKALWAEGYPGMRLAADNVAAGESLGYTSLGHFTIDPECWDTFYADVERRMEEAEPLWGDDPDGRAIIDVTRKEIALYRSYPDIYGYAFHVFRK